MVKNPISEYSGEIDEIAGNELDSLLDKLEEAVNKIKILDNPLTVHLDLRPTNIFLRGDNLNFNVCLGDLGDLHAEIRESENEHSLLSHIIPFTNIAESKSLDPLEEYCHTPHWQFNIMLRKFLEDKSFSNDIYIREFFYSFITKIHRNIVSKKRTPNTSSSYFKILYNKAKTKILKIAKTRLTLVRRQVLLTKGYNPQASGFQRASRGGYRPIEENVQVVHLSDTNAISCKEHLIANLDGLGRYLLASIVHADRSLLERFASFYGMDSVALMGTY